jgi:hypothetical protein
VAAGVLAAAGAGSGHASSAEAVARARASIGEAFAAVASPSFRQALGRLTAALG